MSAHSGSPLLFRETGFRRSLACVLAIVLAGAFLPLISAVPAVGADWYFETLDGRTNAPNGSINADVGKDTAALVYNNRPHVWYYHEGKGELRHAWWTGRYWWFETLDGHRYAANGSIAGDVGTDSAVTLYRGMPHVWYQDVANENLRHAWWTGTTWRFETLDGYVNDANGRIDADVGGYAAVMLYGAQPHVWYQGGGNLRHAWWTGSKWNFETLDGDKPGPNGQVDCWVGAISEPVRYGVQVHVWYYDGDDYDLRHAWWTGRTWMFEALDGHMPGPTGQIEGDVGGGSTAASYGGLPHVWYYDYDGDDLRHAWWTGTVWWFETLDGNGGAGGRTTDRVGTHNAVNLYGGHPHVWYNNATYGHLRHAWWSGGSWWFETLDGEGGTNGRIDSRVGAFNAVALYGGQPHVWYYDFDGHDLRHAWYG